MLVYLARDAMVLGYISYVRRRHISNISEGEREGGMEGGRGEGGREGGGREGGGREGGRREGGREERRGREREGVKEGERERVEKVEGKRNWLMIFLNMFPAYL